MVERDFKDYGTDCGEFVTVIDLCGGSATQPTARFMHYVANFKLSIKFAAKTACKETSHHAAVAQFLFGSGLMSLRVPNDYTCCQTENVAFLCSR